MPPPLPELLHAPGSGDLLASIPLKEGGQIKIHASQVEEWQAHYTLINVKFWVQEMERWASRSPSGKRWPVVEAHSKIEGWLKDEYRKKDLHHSASGNGERPLNREKKLEACVEFNRNKGKPPPYTPPDPRVEHKKALGHLDELIVHLQRSPEHQQISEALNPVISSLQSLRSQLEASLNFNSEELRGRLRGLEEELISAIEKTLSTTQAEDLLDQARKKLARHKEDMTSRVYEETLRTVFRKELEILFGIPAFDLF
jgi:hypothetical protein